MKCLIIFSCLVTSLAAPAYAVTIGFQSSNSSSSLYTESDFRFQVVGTGGLTGPGLTGGGDSRMGTRNNITSNPAGVMFMSHVGGDPFDITSLNAVQRFSSGGETVTTLLMTGFLPNNDQVTATLTGLTIAEQTFNTMNTPDLAAFTGIVNLRFSFTPSGAFSGTQGYISAQLIDDVVVTAVPEPHAAILSLSAVLLLFGRRRRW